MFGEELKKILLNRNLKNSQLQKILNDMGDKCSAGYLGDIIKNKYLPSDKKLNIIISALGLTSEEEKLLKEKWALQKSGNVMEFKINRLEEENKNLKKVLERVKPEILLLEEIDNLKKYKEICELILDLADTDDLEFILKVFIEKIENKAYKENKISEVKKDLDFLKKIIINK